MIRLNEDEGINETKVCIGEVENINSCSEELLLRVKKASGQFGDRVGLTLGTIDNFGVNHLDVYMYAKLYDFYDISDDDVLKTLNRIFKTTFRQGRTTEEDTYVALVEIEI